MYFSGTPCKVYDCSVSYRSNVHLIRSAKLFKFEGFVKIVILCINVSTVHQYQYSLHSRLLFESFIKPIELIGIKYTSPPSHPITYLNIYRRGQLEPFPTSSLNTPFCGIFNSIFTIDVAGILRNWFKLS